MICDNCKEEKPDKDFVNSKKLCFRCEYQEKLKKAPKMRVIKRPAMCRMCKNEIVHQEGLKQRQRTVFCSPECAKRGQRTANDYYWRRNILLQG